MLGGFNIGGLGGFSIRGRDYDFFLPREYTILPKTELHVSLWVRFQLRIVGGSRYVQGGRFMRFPTACCLLPAIESARPPDVKQPVHVLKCQKSPTSRGPTKLKGFEVPSGPATEKSGRSGEPKGSKYPRVHLVQENHEEYTVYSLKPKLSDIGYFDPLL